MLVVQSVIHLINFLIPSLPKFDRTPRSFDLVFPLTGFVYFVQPLVCLQLDMEPASRFSGVVCWRGQHYPWWYQGVVHQKLNGWTCNNFFVYQSLPYIECFWVWLANANPSLVQESRDALAMDIKYSPPKFPEQQDILTDAGFSNMLFQVLNLKPGGNLWTAPVCSTWVFMPPSWLLLKTFGCFKKTFSSQLALMGYSTFW